MSILYLKGGKKSNGQGYWRLSKDLFKIIFLYKMSNIASNRYTSFLRLFNKEKFIVNGHQKFSLLIYSIWQTKQGGNAKSLEHMRTVTNKWKVRTIKYTMLQNLTQCTYSLLFKKWLNWRWACFKSVFLLRRTGQKWNTGSVWWLQRVLKTENLWEKTEFPERQI